ncbi:MAG: DUF6152 family protein [Steroidobacteraceae bacterium]
MKFTYRLATLLCLFSCSAWAHHSQAMYDLTKTVTLVGTVKDFQWTNPHCWIQLMVTTDGATAKEWGVEMGNPRQLYRVGWRPATLKTGDKITLTINPLRDGALGGQFYSAVGADGNPIGIAEAKP